MAIFQGQIIDAWGNHSRITFRHTHPAGDPVHPTKALVESIKEVITGDANPVAWEKISLLHAHLLGPEGSIFTFRDARFAHPVITTVIIFPHVDLPAA